jgi:hypothetical protein
MASKKTPNKTPRKAKAKPRETSDLVSSEAARLLNKCPSKGLVSVGFGVRGGHCIVPLCKAKTLRSILASALNQDQTRGRRDGRVKR